MTSSEYDFNSTFHFSFQGFRGVGVVQAYFCILKLFSVNRKRSFLLAAKLLNLCLFIHPLRTINKYITHKLRVHSI
jgi:hypothetical protein